MGLFYFLTLYCFIRGVSSAAEELKPPTGATAGLSSNADSTVGRANRGTRQFRHDKRLAILWYSGSLLACLFGMATKEVMVSAPLIVLLYDRTFCAARSARPGGGGTRCTWHWEARGSRWGVW